jgi:hypothetical protein
MEIYGHRLLDEALILYLLIYKRNKALTINGWDKLIYGQSILEPSPKVPTPKMYSIIALAVVLAIHNIIIFCIGGL